MSLVVRFDDGPAAGQTRRYPHISTALPSLAWTADGGSVEAVYHRSGDGPDRDGTWHYLVVGRVPAPREAGGAP